MNTLMVIAGGLLLLLLCLQLARITGLTSQANATLMFIPLWLLLAASKIIGGIQQPGHTFTGEWPYFLLILAIPTLPALWLWWQLRQ